MIKGPSLFSYLWRLETLTFIPALFYLRVLRNGAAIATAACWFALGRQMDTLYLLLVVLILQIMIFQQVMVEQGRDDGRTL